jgi:hypothetical protein
MPAHAARSFCHRHFAVNPANSQVKTSSTQKKAPAFAGPLPWSLIV